MSRFEFRPNCSERVCTIAWPDYDRFSASAIRNLPQHAGTAVAHGLTTDEALRAVTLSAAEILGVEDRVGSIEPGKDATLIVTDGDILEIPSQVELAFIQGRPVRPGQSPKAIVAKVPRKVPATSRGVRQSNAPMRRRETP